MDGGIALPAVTLASVIEFQTDDLSGLTDEPVAVRPSRSLY